MTKCEKCRERAATVFIKRVMDNQSSHAKLCEECAREEAIATAWLSGAPVPPEAAEMPLEELLMELLSGAPDPDSFAPEDDKWSLQKLAAYDALHSRGEFPADEDLADDIDEMDSEEDAGSPLDEESEALPEDIQAALDEMEPEQREAVSQMLDALDEVQQQLESIILEHSQAEDEEGDDTLARLQALAGMDTPQGDALDSEPFADEDGSEQGSFGTFHLPPDFLGLGDTPSSFDEEESEDAPPAFKSAPSQPCPKCRTTWDRLREDGRAGCSSCYEAFAEQLGEMMDRQQHASHHVGKAPRAATRRRQRLEALRARRDSRLEMLREKLAAALRDEHFEEAAKLRDKIKVIESTIVDASE